MTDLECLGPAGIALNADRKMNKDYLDGYLMARYTPYGQCELALYSITYEGIWTLSLVIRACGCQALGLRSLPRAVTWLPYYTILLPLPV